ncbi:TPA: hypothetical protein SCW97_001758 [Campylobacter jejuni]|uniref:hypothetical protein n=1 Tax=Campylobacter jejuni TaxID=197 RepID=UPI0008756405|nr:hypothetical protein [Campylobacter jejuni]EAJ2975645.1 hypothetical protein [Campylobacter jejuni]EAJ8747113.1 hypothetical protein [Campylobacter jejuni]EDP2897582.1 hypothetical protein [Campylobacter jejuni]EGR9265317.1 hypothetical protein [Campylobacter jejuni]MCW1355782.1 hypothetical protein [Campylobacter jejuni]
MLRRITIGNKKLWTTYISEDNSKFFFELYRRKEVKNMAFKCLEKFSLSSKLITALVKNNFLNFYFNNTSALMEFNNKKEFIKDELRIIYKQNYQKYMHELALIFKDIKAETTFKYMKETDYNPKKQIGKIYKESSSGDFAIKENNAFREQLLSIQKIIKNNIAKENIHLGANT